MTTWSGWQELNLRGHAPKACGWPLPYTRTLVARHGIEPCPPAFSEQHSSVEFTSQNLVDGARVELAFHGCRPWVIPLYEPPIWGEMRESNSRDWSHNPVPKPFGQSRHKTSGAGRVNRTLIGEVQALCTATVLDQQTLGAGTQPRTAVGHLPCAGSSR
jgi:hypothetical protein